MKRILLVEDEISLQETIKLNLDLEGYKVNTVGDGKSALKAFKQERFDLIVLDVMLPEMDGFKVCEAIRLENKEIPILFLTAKNSSADKIAGLRLGADDYLTKPFSMEELLARVNAILKRVSPVEVNVNTEMYIGKIRYEPELRILHVQEGPKKLTTKENDLLLLLVKNQNEILDRQATLRAVWGDDNYFNGRSMDVYIAKLRKLLKDDENIEIMNIHGKGFKLLIR
jgi:DNA-binding response OmpR family regulator